jgi:2,3-bisphosphoglycerate-dependent phosphoglycerate mutase
MTRLTLIRHGESNVTVRRIIGGLKSCTGLSPLGIQQAEQLRDRLTRTAEIEADVLISSTMARARETAQIIAPSLNNLEVLEVPSMCEHDPGPCDGMTFADYVAKFGHPDWAADPDAEVFPGGETVRQFHSRIKAGLDGLLKQHVDQRIVLVCHGGVIDAALRHLMALPMIGGFELHTLNTSLTELRFRPDIWRLVRYNDAAHLEGLPAETPSTLTAPPAAATPVASDRR